MTRQAANMEILHKLAMLAQRLPDYRFHQLLWLVCMEDNWEDRFYEESMETLSRLEQNENFNKILCYPTK